MAEKLKVYYNLKQIEAMTVAANCEYIIAARGFGKSEGIDAPRLLRNVQHMPSSTGALLSPTYKKLLINTLPAVKLGLLRLGYKQDLHYVIGKKPPKSLSFAKPRRQPDNWEYIMSWYNGSIINLLSFDRSMSANSMSLDYYLGFEAKFLNYDKIINEVIPATRGNLDQFPDCPWHGGQVFTTDMPTFKSGMWILEKQKLMDRELIQCILETEGELRMLKAMHNDTDYHYSKIQALQADLNLFRRNAIFYAEYDIFDNLELIGEKRIREFKRDLPPLIFQTAILNKRLYKIPNGFYSALNEKIHCYEAQSPDRLESFASTLTNLSNDCRNDGDVIDDKHLIIAFDYNAAICSVATAQVHGREMPTLSSMFVKTPRKLQELVEDWCDYYHYHPTHNVVYYYDSTAIFDTPIGSESFADVVQRILTKRGWNVNAVYIGQPIKHQLKHNYIDMALKGNTEYLFPSFNKHNNEYLWMAMEQTGIKQGRNGFEKDKGPEKTPDSIEQPDEYKTHITDAWDTLFIGCNFYPVTYNTSLILPTSFG